MRWEGQSLSWRLKWPLDHTQLTSLLQIREMSAYDRGGASMVSLIILPKGLQFCFPKGSFSTSLKTVQQCQCFPGMQFTKRPVFGSESCRVHCRTKALVPEVQKCDMAPRFGLQQYHCRKQHCPLALEIPAFPRRKVCTPNFPQSRDFDQLSWR